MTKFIKVLIILQFICNIIAGVCISIGGEYAKFGIYYDWFFVVSGVIIFLPFIIWFTKFYWDKEINMRKPKIAKKEESHETTTKGKTLEENNE